MQMMSGIGGVGGREWVGVLVRVAMGVGAS